MTKRKLTIATYHFVRDQAGSRFPGIKARTLDEFKAQLEYILDNYTVIRMEDLLGALSGVHEPLAPNSLLMTFDDGYREHFTHVFPILQAAGVQGSFFPCGRAVMERAVLDMNKIHFILAAMQDHSRIVSFIFSALDAMRPLSGLQDNLEYYRELAVPGRFDTGEVIFIKRLLQRELPEHVRGEIIDRLFKKHVTADEGAFADELYLSAEQLKQMKEAGMFIGSHGWGHRWMDTLPPGEQEREIDLSVDMLRVMGVGDDELVMCYPYGAYSGPLIDLLKARGFRAGLSVDAGIADLDLDDPFALKRLDTNDLPVLARGFTKEENGAAPVEEVRGP